MNSVSGIVVSGVHLTGVHRSFAPFYCGHTSIMLLHRVRESDRSLDMNQELDVSPACLESFIVQKKQAGWRFVSMDYLLENWDECCRRKKNLVMTLDDGYRDNCQHAWPLFQKHDVPFLVYVTTSFPNRTAVLWWYALADLVRRNKVIVLEGAGAAVIPTGNPHTAFTRLREQYLSRTPSDQPAFLRSLLERHDSGYRVEEDLISWDELVKMSRDPLCVIGCHTANHVNLARLHEQGVFQEVLDARDQLTEKLSMPIRHFAYPYGKRSEASLREADISRQLGFRSAVTTRIGNLFPEHRDQLHLLPRIPMYHGGWRGKLSEIYASGMYSAVMNGFRRVVTD